MGKNYTVPPEKAANIRKAMSTVVSLAQGTRTPVRYASMGKDFVPTPRAIKEGVPLSPVLCVEAITCEDLGTPGYIARREAYLYEPNRAGTMQITVYAKSEEATDHFDKTGNFANHRFKLNAWPKSWFPDYLAELNRKNKKNVAKRLYTKRAKIDPGRPVRITSVTTRAKKAA